jgi:hypothetical protein
MYEYLCNHKKMDYGNFIGECSYIFMSCRIRNRHKRDVRAFVPDVGTIVNSFDSGYMNDRREKVEYLYKFAKEIYGKNKPDYIEVIMRPFIDSDLFVGDYGIQWFYRNWDKKPAFVIEVNLDPELFEIDEKDVMGRGQLGDTHLG